MTVKIPSIKIDTMHVNMDTMKSKIPTMNVKARSQKVYTDATPVKPTCRQNPSLLREIRDEAMRTQNELN